MKTQELNKLHTIFSKYETEFNIIDEKIKEICEFNAGLTFCSGDGHLVINSDTSNVAPLYCLKGKSKSNKLTEEEHRNNCI